MKKTVFVAQVFALIAMLPLVVILQINHVLPHRSAPFDHVSESKNAIIELPGKTSGELSEEALSLSVEAFLLKTTDKKRFVMTK
ncbi:MAG TPA: hypothetical protein VK625_04430 [Flavitalea sp.]|nr:hypothetical protein [Flavitalea sp.]